MSNLRLYTTLLLFCLIIKNPSAAEERFPMAKTGCKDTCGNVTIPYPFGIGSACALREFFEINCSVTNVNSLKPYLTKLMLEVLGIYLENQTIVINSPVRQTCKSQPENVTVQRGLDLAGTPFLFSMKHNTLRFFGCGNALLKWKEGGDQVLSGCTSTCKISNKNITACYGINCCETNIPFYLTYYELDFTVTESEAACASTFLAKLNWPERFSADLSVQGSFPFVPVVLAWTLGNRSEFDSNQGCIPKPTYLQVTQNSSLTTYRCVCQKNPPLPPTEFNPYLDGACDYVYDSLTGQKKNWAAVTVGASVGVGGLFLMIVTLILSKLVRKRRNKRRKQKFFERNGGLLLERQLSANEGVIKMAKIFADKELIRATDGFNPNLILGQGGQGTVYKGMLNDGRMVAIKKSKKVDESQLGQFINEVVILSQVIHRNVVKLLGCCLETQVPLLVYEFIPNGTLHRFLHDGNADDIPFTWNLRLRIATEVAGALAYLHSAISIPIFHRDIKSSNILLDEKYIAKVSDFGTSMNVAEDKTHLTTLVKGTIGYMDPEYFQSSQFTEKSDVYSFGVVLVELLTRQKPISVTGTGEGSSNRSSLATRFLTCMDEDSLSAILDPQIVDQKNEEEVFAVAKLAQRCLNLDGKKRPTMKEVAIALENVKLSSMSSANPTNVQGTFSIEQNSIVSSGKNKSITSSKYETGSESISLHTDDYPLLHSYISSP